MNRTADKPDAASNETGLTQRLSFKEKVAYGLGGGAEIIMANSILILAMPVYYLGLGVRAEVLGLILLGTKIFDAVTDTFMGHLSDNSRLRWGRRKPYILLGGLVAGLICIPLWRPVQMSTAGYMWYFFLISILYYLFYTVFYVPYNALGYEMTRDYDERTRLMTYKWGIGSVMGIGILPLLLPLCYAIDPNNAAVGARFWGPLAGGMIVLLCIAPSVVPRERIVHQEKIPFFRALATTLQNKPFLLLCGIIVLALVGIIGMLQLRLFLNMAYVYQMDQKVSADMVKWFDYLYGAVNTLGMFGAGFLAVRFDKKKVLAAGLLMVAVGIAASWFYITPRYPYLQLLLGLLTAPGMSCVWVLTNSCIADVCDYDELSTGMRREGLYGAVFSFSMKLGSAIGLGLCGFVLWLVGFDKELTAQTYETVIRFRLAFALIPALFFAAALALAWKYPINKQSLLDVQRQLAARKE